MKTSIDKSKHNELTGILATLEDLIRARPSKKATGFSPTGRVTTHQWGSNASVFRGRGMEFAESRAYQAGDDMRHIDWRVTARTGKAHTKLFQEERERPVQILLDMRPMMHFGTRTRFKSNLAAEITAQLAWVAHDGGDRLGAQILHAQGVSDFRATRTRRAILRFLENVSDNTNPQQATTNAQQTLSLTEGIRRVRRVSRPGTLTFIISDFNDLDENSAQDLTRLSAHSCVTVIQVFDPLDMALPSLSGRLTDGEHLVSLTNASRTQLRSYSDAFTARQNLLIKTCQKNGMTYHAQETTEDAKKLLHIQK